VVKGVAILSSRVRFPNLATRKWLLRFLLAGKRKGWFQGARMGGKARDGCRVGLKGVLASFARTGTRDYSFSSPSREAFRTTLRSCPLASLLTTPPW
jgi:hypothetical protein